VNVNVLVKEVVVMTSMYEAEYRRRLRVARVREEQRVQHLPRDQFFTTFRPVVYRLLHEVGRTWGAIDLDHPPQAPPRSVLERMLSPAPHRIARAYQIAEPVGAFPTPDQADIYLTLGLAAWNGQQWEMANQPGIESGGFRISLYFDYQEVPGGSFVLASTRPFLSAYLCMFTDFAALQDALVEAWTMGLFTGPYSVYMPSHETWYQ
jgi:hypothetical protein